MSGVVFSSDVTMGEIIEEVSKRLARFAVPGKLPLANRWNVMVKINKRDMRILEFVFVTKEGKRINFKVSAIQLRKQGIEYIEKGIGKLFQDLQAQRKEDQEKGAIILSPTLAERAAVSVTKQALLASPDEVH